MHCRQPNDIDKPVEDCWLTSSGTLLRGACRQHKDSKKPADWRVSCLRPVTLGFVLRNLDLELNPSPALAAYLTRFAIR